MKKTIALMLALLMLCTASVALAEEDGKLEPLFATVSRMGSTTAPWPSWTTRPRRWSRPSWKRT